MSRKIICLPEDCTACKACLNVCKLNCIEMVKDKQDVSRYKISVDKCIDCGLCRKVCPVLHNSKNQPHKAYVAWSNNEERHAKSASGGIAAELYSFLLKKNFSLVGTKWSDDFTVRLCIGDTTEDIIKFQNSKYTYSDPVYIYRDVVEEINQGANVLFVGLPCQTAAMANILQYRNMRDKCILVDLVCHGIPPSEYLQQHVKYIENIKGKKVKTIIFRDPERGTENYWFSLFGIDCGCFYTRHVKRNDVYHLGYHRALIYRDNCYHCKFTTHQRCGDLTLADYSGLGTGGEVDFKHGSQLSCILCNTSRGENLISEIIADGVIKAYERPLTEELGNERQLNAPSIPHVNRDVFLATYKKTKNFEIAAYKALRKDIYKNELMHYLLVDKIIGLPRKIAKIILPERMKKYIKRWLHKK